MVERARLRATGATVLLASMQFVAHPATAQMTRGVLERTVLVESQTEKGTTERGTMFSVDVDQREYWITAKHILTGADSSPHGLVKSSSVTLKVRNPIVDAEDMEPVEFTVWDAGKDVDIVVLTTKNSLINKIYGPRSAAVGTATVDASGVLFGGDCEFVGFPFGSSWRVTWDTGGIAWFPFIKRCTVSGMQKEPNFLWVLDGINNKGFSGGPVTVGTGDNLKIIGVVSGYHLEPADVFPVPEKGAAAGHSGPSPNPTPNGYANVNSGFILAYNINYALDVIKAHPVGALRTSQ